MEDKKKSTFIRTIVEVIALLLAAYFGVDLSSKTEEAVKADPQWSALADLKTEVEVLKWRVQTLESVTSLNVPAPSFIEPKIDSDKLRNRYKGKKK